MRITTRLLKECQEYSRSLYIRAGLLMCLCTWKSALICAIEKLPSSEVQTESVCDTKHNSMRKRQQQPESKTLRNAQHTPQNTPPT